MLSSTPQMIMAYTIWQAMCGNGVLMRMKVMKILGCCVVALGLILPGLCGSPPAVGLLRRFTSAYYRFSLCKGRSLSISCFRCICKSLSVVTYKARLSYLGTYSDKTFQIIWILYQLSEPVDVAVTIHSINGSLIRTLALGISLRVCIRAKTVRRIGMVVTRSVNVLRAVSISIR